jgi:chemosensory pili system protein ChpC
MSEPANSVFALLLSLQGGRLLLPNLAVAEVVSLDGLQAPSAGAPAWLLGRLPWQGLEIPLLRFESLNGRPVDAPGRRSRAVIVNCLGRQLATGRFGLVCDGYPHLATIEADALQAAELRPDDHSGFVLCRAVLGGESVAIPDLDALEQALAAVAG